ncbi:MAG: phosphopyruvate hydratase [Thermomicrobiales bacterium]
MPEIASLRALEILDSRGRPTVLATCTLASGAQASASVPSGASTGAAEALELRDGDPKRYRGLGCRTAVANINTTINDALRGTEFPDQAALDRAIIALDGTPNKSSLGANAILAVSLAFARAVAEERSVPLYQHFADIIAPGQPIATLSRPTVNLFSGGKHAGGQVSIQDVLIVPVFAQTIDESMATIYAVYQAAVDLCRDKYGMRALVADEGGLAPEFSSIEAMLDDAVRSIEAAGYRPGEDVAICVDVASSHFYEDGRYRLNDRPLSAEEMIDTLSGWLDRYPIVSVEDGLAEDDWGNWPALKQRIGDRALVLGDDLLTTNPRRIQKAINLDAANALLLKVNQIGTLTEAAEACNLARSEGWHVTVSARSGETEDDWLSDLAVGWGGNHLKVGSITRSERLAKWNRLLAIEAETSLPVA